MRMFETGELVLFAVVVAELDLLVSIYAALSHAYVYISSVPILALYATKAALTAKTIVFCALVMMFGLVKIRALAKRRTDMPPRIEKILRTALYAYIAFVYAALAVLAAALESLPVPPIFSQIP